MSGAIAARDLLLARLVDLARSVPDAALTAVADALDALPAGAGEAKWLAAATRVQDAAARQRVVRLLDERARTCPDLPPASLALALRAAAQSEAWHRNNQRLELVWTGIESAKSQFRRTDQALLEVIACATERLLLVSFSAYDMAPVVDSLGKAIDRGVRLRVVLELPRVEGGKVSGEPRRAFGDALAARSEFYVWPLHRRPRDDRGEYGALHAKCAVADDAKAFVSSANLTGHAMSLNMELGLVVSGGPIPARAAHHFDQLIAAGVLERTGKAD